LHDGTLDFSFAGLKTAVRTQALKPSFNVCEQNRADLAASTQQAIVEVLVRKTLSALQRTGLDRVVVAGGVGANARLREMLDAECAKRRARVHYPELALCTDNGAMIALAAAMRLQRGLATPQRHHAFEVRPRWPLATL
jgi:N6-L-threonylcarbamoyladenine synthase